MGQPISVEVPMSGTKVLEQIKEAAFIDELQQTEEGVNVGVALGLLTKEATAPDPKADKVIPPAKVTPKPKTKAQAARANAATAFKSRFGSLGV
jgi:hypothetical protein